MIPITLPLCPRGHLIEKRLRSIPPKDQSRDRLLLPRWTKQRSCRDARLMRGEPALRPITFSPGHRPPSSARLPLSYPALQQAAILNLTLRSPHARQTPQAIRHLRTRTAATWEQTRRSFLLNTHRPCELLTSFQALILQQQRTNARHIECPPSLVIASEAPDPLGPTLL